LRRKKNKNIIEATNAMMHDQSLPMLLWSKACMKTIYIQNRSPHQILKNITPEEAFTGGNLDIEHFKIFGCPVYFLCTQREEVQARPFQGERIH
jgi:hypothetical protein